MIILTKDILDVCHIRTNLSTGTKECYSGPLHLVESIRIALGDTPNHENQSSEPEHPGDKPLNRSVQTKDTSDVDNKNDTNTGMQRQKVPQM